MFITLTNNEKDEFYANATIYYEEKPCRFFGPGSDVTQDILRQLNRIDDLRKFRPERTNSPITITRDDGPAVSMPNGAWEWYKDGQRHRIDGPASCFKMVDNQEVHMWYKHGRIHRTDGPAIVYTNNEAIVPHPFEENKTITLTNKYYINGRELKVTPMDFSKYMQRYR